MARRDEQPLPDQHSPLDPKTGQPGTQSPEKFARHLRDVRWPASKEDIVRHARSSAAPDEVVRAIERLPGARFGSVDEVLVAYEDAHAAQREGHGRPPG